MKDIGLKGFVAIGVIVVQFVILVSFWKFEGSTTNTMVYRSPYSEGSFGIKDLREPPHICLLVLSTDKASDKNREAKDHPFVTSFVPSLVSSIANDRTSLYFLSFGYSSNNVEESTINYIERNVTKQIHDQRIVFETVKLSSDADLASYNEISQYQIEKGHGCNYYYLLSDRVTFQSSYWYRTLPESLHGPFYKDFGYSTPKELSGTSNELFGMLPVTHLQIFGGNIFPSSSIFTGQYSFAESGAFLSTLYNPLKSSWFLTSEVIRSTTNYGVQSTLNNHQQELCEAYNRIANWLSEHLATSQAKEVRDVLTSKGCKITTTSPSGSSATHNAPPSAPRTIVTYADTCPAVVSQLDDEKVKWAANMEKVQARYDDIHYMNENPHTKREFNEIPGLMYDLFQPSAECEFHDRVGGASDGGKWICDNSRIINKPCRIYSFGVGLTIAFETEYHDLGCDTWSFDPTPGLFDARSSWFKPGMHFEVIGLGPTGGSIDNPEFNLVLNGQQVPSMSFGQLRAKYGHDTVDILKIDVEGAEWKALPYLLSEPSFNTSGVKMILLEMHIHQWNEGLWSYVPQFFKMMEDHGFYLYQKDANVNLWPGNPPFFCCYEWAWAHKSYLYPHLFNKPEFI
mmetsp:Transcript_9431/g.12998  ORF Transcript_9431/g.12998 Transcript_9431/m.12998 type:complete len:626 (+) Transcript_9431:198-2075(+)